MEVYEVTFDVGAWVRGVVYVWPRSVAAYWGSAVVNMMSGSISPSTTPHAPAPASSL